MWASFPWIKCVCWKGCHQILDLGPPQIQRLSSQNAGEPFNPWLVHQRTVLTPDRLWGYVCFCCSLVPCAQSTASLSHPAHSAAFLPQSFLYSINQTICLRLDSIEAKLLALDATCKSLEEKLDLVMNKQHSPIQVPMVAGSPLGATQTCNKVRW